MRLSVRLRKRRLYGCTAARFAEAGIAVDILPYRLEQNDLNHKGFQ